MIANINFKIDTFINFSSSFAVAKRLRSNVEALNKWCLLFFHYFWILTYYLYKFDESNDY